ncbi:MAG: VWA domain-containing protein [Clostridiales bacterium]|nr:VWA domain-containing protein [Clostridiales bacterium]
MKKLDKIAAILLAMVLCIGVWSLPASAATVSQDGVETVLTTNQESYSQGEDITATLTVTNTNDVTVTDMILEGIVPEGYVPAEGSASAITVSELAAGETSEITVTYVAEDAAGNTSGDTAGVTSDADGGSDDGKNSGSLSGSTSSDESSGEGTGSGDSGSGSGSSSGADGSSDDDSSDAISLVTKIKTGDNNHAIVWVLLCVCAGGVVTVVAVRSKKARKTLLSLMLCVVMAGSVVITTKASAAETDAESTARSIRVETTVSVGGEELTIQGNVSYTVEADYLDTDGDGLYDAEEDYYGTDPDNPDTDGDGFSDFAEVYLMGTDPLTPDDPDTDTDGDGLTDGEEVNTYGTDINAVDTDGDGLTDYEEVYVYHTDPTATDTDGDGLSDSFELEHGLDPTKESTDGKTNDADVSIEQTISESGISVALTDEDNIAQPGLEGSVCGEMADHVFLAVSEDSSFTDNRALVGEAVYVDAADAYVAGLTLTFDVSAYGGDIETLGICVLGDDGSYDLMDTAASGTVLSCKLTESGTYFVMDIDTFLSSLGIDLDAYVSAGGTSVEVYSSEESTVSGTEETEANEIDPSLMEEAEEAGADSDSAEDAMAAAGAKDGTSDADTEGSETVASEYSPDLDLDAVEVLAEENAETLASSVSGVSGQADIAFVIDTTGSMSSYIDNVITNVAAFATTLADNYNVQVNYALIDFRDLEEDGADTTKVVQNGSSNWFTSTSSFISALDTLTAEGGGDLDECDVDALEAARNLNWRSSSSKFIILITDAGYKTVNNYGISSMEEETELLTEDGIITSVVTTTSYRYTYQSVYESTGGIFADISDDFSSVLLSLADLIGENTADGEWVILKHGYRYVKLPEIPENEADSSDTDGDSLSDYEELGEAEELDLSAWIFYRLSLSDVPATEYAGKTSITVYDAYSDPTTDDTDDDGIADAKDDAPWTRGYADGSIGELYLVSCNGNSVATVVVTLGRNTGHSFIAYESYVKDSLDLSDFNRGFATATGSWSDSSELSSTGKYRFTLGDMVTLGAGGFYTEDAKCAVYNMELYKHFVSGGNYDYNYYISEKVTSSDVQKMLNAFGSESEKDYSLIKNNCTNVALRVWNSTFGTSYNMAGINTPKSLYNYLSEMDGSGYSFKFDDYYAD